MEITLQGFKELQKMLMEFGPKLAANAQRNATRDAAAVFRNATRATAPVRTGLLRASLVVNKRRSNEGRYVVKYGVKLRPGKKLKYANTARNRRLRRVGKTFNLESAAFYGRFLEFGTSKMRPRPFMRPAFYANQGQALEAFKQRMAKGVEEAARTR